MLSVRLLHLIKKLRSASTSSGHRHYVLHISQLCILQKCSRLTCPVMKKPDKKVQFFHDFRLWDSNGSIQRMFPTLAAQAANEAILILNCTSRSNPLEIDLAEFTILIPYSYKLHAPSLLKDNPSIC